MTAFGRILLLAVLAGLIATASVGLSESRAQGDPTAPSDSQVRELQNQIHSLQAELDQLRAAQDPESRRRMMGRHWQGMENYMGHMRQRWGMGEPWMMGSDSMGCPMMGGGSGSPLPEGVSPEQYSQQMRDHMQRMQEQMNTIAQTTDPKERERLMQEHWRGMYRDMQTMRGMGWMWNGPMMGHGMIPGAPVPGGPPPSSQSLPDPSGAGAKLVSTYCTQCHAAPQPTLHTAEEWTGVTQRMHARMTGGWVGVKTPSEQEMGSIVAYLKEHAR